MPKRKKVNPLDEALAEKEKVSAARDAEDLRLVRQWKQEPTPDNMHQLLQRFAPVFKQKTRLWRAPNVPESAFNANLKLQGVNAFKTYEEGMGASVRTHVENRLKKSMRFNAQQNNNARIGEAKSYQIGPIHRAQDELREELGRPPTPTEISEFLNPMMGPRKQLTPQKVEQIQKAQIRDIIGSSFDSDPVPKAIGRERQVIGLLRPALTPDQQVVFDHLYGLNGKRRINSTNELSAELGKSPSQISRLRTGIFQQFQKYNR